MLKIFKNQENIIMTFFVITILLVGGYVFFDQSIIDFIYLGILIYYFSRFLFIKTNRK